MWGKGPARRLASWVTTTMEWGATAGNDNDGPGRQQQDDDNNEDNNYWSVKTTR